MPCRGGGSAFVVGSPAIHRHVEDAGLRIVNGTEFASRADVVVLAAYDDFHYDELRVATQAGLRGAELLAAGRDATFPMPDGPWPGTGAIVAAVEYATGRTALSVGKPEAWLYRTALDRLGQGRALVVGDRVDVDLAGAAAARLDGAIVLTGASTRAEAAAAKDPEPVAVADTLADLVLQATVRRAEHAPAHPPQALLAQGLPAPARPARGARVVHRVATGRVKPRMGSGRPIAPISKVRTVESGLSITINTEGAVIDAYVVTDKPDEVAAWMRAEGLAR